MSRFALRTGSLALLLGLLCGCKASVSVNANANVNGKTKKSESSFDSLPPPSSSTLQEANKPVATTAFIGVTQALSLTAEASATPSCKCMAAVVGMPASQAFVWRGSAPTVGEDALVLGISNDGTPCDVKSTGKGPSIAAVESDGSNVIVTIEESRAGRPQAHGAVFQRPATSSGYVIFRSSSRLPYAKPLPGASSNVCRIPLANIIK